MNNLKEDLILNAEGIVKQFPGVLALDNVDFKLRRNEIHALCGENGAGKSTLLKILTGIYAKTKGTILQDGKKIEINNIDGARKHGIYVVPQELQMEPELSVAENIFMSKYPRNKFGFVNWKYIYSKAQELQNALGQNAATINLHAKVKSLSMGHKQLIEIMRSMTHPGIKILAFDEPTSSLSTEETKQLFELIRTFKENGMSIIYVSHRLDEVIELCDRVTVYKDGKNSGTRDISTVTRNDIIKMMVGRDLKMFETRVANEEITAKKEIALEIRDFTGTTNFKNVSFHVHYGEIVGLFGIVGAGRTETMRAIFGLDKKVSGEVFIAGKKVNITCPEIAKKNGVGFVTENRRNEGLLLGAPIKWSISMTNFNKIASKRKIINFKKENGFAEESVREFNIKASSINVLGENLSGGNQQKVIIAKWVKSDCKILIFDEPTRGVDVGAKAEIYKRLKELADQGLAIVMVSSELPEILGLSDRIYIFRDGYIESELKNDGSLTESEVLKYAISGY